LTYALCSIAASWERCTSMAARTASAGLSSAGLDRSGNSV
jgi:hypothetical protein